ncbi:MAG: MFS transporter [Syntrophobacteraceae bacterium]|jgi:GPH family glycoside/pentoside/hexuronide:cation symporter|nr:MFS transporter [Syntrophobacteraceae bacterium]
MAAHKPQPPDERLPLARKLAYAAPAFTLAIVGIPVYVYIPKFYTDVVGVSLGTIGFLIFSVRIFDAFSDPVLGFLSDRWRTRWGRRRPLIALGSLALSVSILFLFNPPAGPGTGGAAWFGIWIFLLFLFWTVVQVPYEALGPEITSSFDERTGLFSYRDGALILGTLVAASSPALVSWLAGLDAGAEGERSKFFWISMAYAPLLMASCLWCISVIREQPARIDGNNAGPLLGAFRDVLGNRPFVILLLSYTVSAFGSNLPATLILYYVQYVLESPHADLFLLIYFATGIVCLPAWVLVSGRWGKKEAWLTSMVVNTGAFVAVFFLGPGDGHIYGLLVFISGIGFGATLALPSAMQADVIDYDELISGQRREGLYVGFWSVSKKLAAAMGVGIALWLLGRSGYVPNVPQSEEVRWMLRVLYALVPSCCNVLAFVIASRYPIDRSAHMAILDSVNEARSGRTVCDPLRPSHCMSWRNSSQYPGL